MLILRWGWSSGIAGKPNGGFHHPTAPFRDRAGNVSFGAF
jgi:hypothetical protein